MKRETHIDGYFAACDWMVAVINPADPADPGEWMAFPAGWQEARENAEYVAMTEDGRPCYCIGRNDDDEPIVVPMNRTGNKNLEKVTERLASLDDPFATQFRLALNSLRKGSN